VEGHEKEVKWKPRIGRTKEESRPARPDGSFVPKDQRRLLADHLLHDVSDNRQLELFMAVGFEHTENPNREECQTNHREQEKADETDGEMQYCGDHGEKKAEDHVENPHCDETNIQRDRLRTVKLYKGPFVDQEKDQTGDPAN
jgi:hypothetical protein